MGIFFFTTILGCKILQNIHLFLVVASADVGYQISSVNSFKAYRASNESTLYTAQLEIANAYGLWPVYLLDLHGSRFQMGYDYGVMLANEIKMGWDFLQNMIITKGGGHWYDIALMAVIDNAIDWQVLSALASFSYFTYLFIVDRLPERWHSSCIPTGD